MYKNHCRCEFRTNLQSALFSGQFANLALFLVEAIWEWFLGFNIRGCHHWRWVCGLIQQILMVWRIDSYPNIGKSCKMGRNCQDRKPQKVLRLQKIQWLESRWKTYVWDIRGYWFEQVQLLKTCYLQLHKWPLFTVRIMAFGYAST